MKLNLSIAFAIFAFLPVFTSCTKEEGVGGTSTIEGYLFKVVHADDEFTLSVDTIPAAKTDVYIIYGDEKFYGDDIETGSDGFYRFKYLNKGTYTIFAYSTYASGEKDTVSKTITVGKGDTKNVNPIYIHEGKAFGTSIVKGKVNVRYWYEGNTVKNIDNTTRIDPASDVRVYIQRAEDDFYIGDVRTSDDGTFIFQKLAVGTYEIYVYTVSADDLLYEKIISPIYQQIEVTKQDSIFEITEPFLITQVL